MYKFFFSNVVQASLVSLVGWSFWQETIQSPSLKKIPLSNHFIKLRTYRESFLSSEYQFYFILTLFLYRHHLFLTSPHSVTVAEATEFVFKV